VDLSTEYVSSTEAARLLEYDTSHVRRLCSEGKLDAVKIGRNWLVKRSSIQAYKENKPKPGPRPGRD